VTPDETLQAAALLGAVSGLGTREDPFVRPTARVLLADAADRVLLFSAFEHDQETGRPFWFPPGGGLDPGEEYEDAALREVFEETGIRLTGPGACIWLREHDWSLQGTWVRSVERYFFARVTGSEVIRDNWTELEVQAIRECRWWGFDELLASTDIFVPRDLCTLLPPLLRGEMPPAPLAVR